MSYDPASTDAMFSRIEMRLDTQDSTLKEILHEVRKTNGRVTRLETAGAVTRGKIALISAFVTGAIGMAGWLVSVLLRAPH